MIEKVKIIIIIIIVVVTIIIVVVTIIIIIMYYHFLILVVNVFKKILRKWFCSTSFKMWDVMRVRYFN